MSRRIHHTVRNGVSSARWFINNLPGLSPSVGDLGAAERFSVFRDDGYPRCGLR